MAQVESELAEKQAKREDLDQQIEQKTAQVNAIINYIPDHVMDLLKSYKSEQDAFRALMGSKWTDTDRLFVQENGLPMYHTTPYIWFKRFCESHDFKFCDIHSLRHFYASSLINEGVDPAAVSSALGHSVIGTTLNLYSHMFQEARARNCDAISNALSFTNDPARERRIIQSVGA